MVLLIGAGNLSEPTQVMRLRRALLKTPARSSVLSGLLLHKNSSSLTRSESTLLQVFIPRHFISPRINTYKKTPGGYLSQHHKDLQLVTPSTSPIWPHRNAHNPNPFMHLRTLSITPRGYPLTHTKLRSSRAKSRDLLFLPTGHGSRVTGHVYWSPGTVAPQPAKCQNHGCYSLAAPRETFRSSRCLIHESGHRARHP